jgi:hypothetical protein
VHPFNAQPITTWPPTHSHATIVLHALLDNTALAVVDIPVATAFPVALTALTCNTEQGAAGPVLAAAPFVEDAALGKNSAAAQGVDYLIRIPAPAVKVENMAVVDDPEHVQTAGLESITHAKVRRTRRGAFRAHLGRTAPTLEREGATNARNAPPESFRLALAPPAGTVVSTVPWERSAPSLEPGMCASAVRGVRTTTIWANWNANPAWQEPTCRRMVRRYAAYAVSENTTALLHRPPQARACCAARGNSTRWKAGRIRLRARRVHSDPMASHKARRCALAVRLVPSLRRSDGTNHARPVQLENTTLTVVVVRLLRVGTVM